MSEGSIMPAYMVFLEQNLDTSETGAKIRAMQTLGVPYEKGYDKIANNELMAQANTIAESLQADSIRISPNKEVIAIIAYLQRMGTDISKNKTDK
jgi:cytochrome c oxidase cbb3-type subunit I/II